MPARKSGMKIAGAREKRKREAPGRSLGGGKGSKKRAAAGGRGAKRSSSRGTKGRQARAERAMERRAPQLVENPKSRIFIRGAKTSERCRGVMEDLYALTAPLAKKLNKRNEMRPFEDQSSLEFLAAKNDCSLFAFSSHSKKRPHNVIIGRTYDAHVMDMAEFGIDAFVALSEISGPSASGGAKPCVVFRGAEFDSDPDFVCVKSLLLDFFRIGATAEATNIHRPGIRHVIVVYSAPGRKCLIRTHVVNVEPSSTNPELPRIELIPMGPSMDLTLRRTKWAAPDMVRASLKQPKHHVAKKVKNVHTDEMLGTMGRLHVGRQDLESLQTRKTRALRKPKELKSL